jgi:hypothetical protein
MAESITHFAVCDDSMRLALNAPEVNATLVRVGRHERGRTVARIKGPRRTMSSLVV